MIKIFEYYCVIEKSFDEKWEEGAVLKWDKPQKQTPKGRKESIMIMRCGEIKVVANTIGLGRIEIDETKEIPPQRVKRLKERMEELGLPTSPIYGKSKEGE